jgi:hypothetical protein
MTKYIYPKACPLEESRAYRFAVGNILGEVLVEVLNPLYAKHPTLRPPGLNDRGDDQLWTSRLRRASRCGNGFAHVCLRNADICKGQTYSNLAYGD